MKTLIILALLLTGCNNGDYRLNILDQKAMDDRQDKFIVENTELLAKHQNLIRLTTGAIVKLNERLKRLEGR